MNADTIAVVRECAQRSHAESITFPEVVAKLAAAGVEWYHADFARSEITYYQPDGTSHTEAAPPRSTPIASSFSAADVATAIKDVQQGRSQYLEFLDRVRAAGCSHYAVFITGKRVHYFGRAGDIHTEHFPQR